MHINILFCSKLGEGEGSNTVILRGVIQLISYSNLENFLFITKDGKFLAFNWLNSQKIIEEQSGCNATSQAGFEGIGTKSCLWDAVYLTACVLSFIHFLIMAVHLRISLRCISKNLSQEKWCRCNLRQCCFLQCLFCLQPGLLCCFGFYLLWSILTQCCRTCHFFQRCRDLK